VPLFFAAVNLHGFVPVGGTSAAHIVGDCGMAAARIVEPCGNASLDAAAFLAASVVGKIVGRCGNFCGNGRWRVVDQPLTLVRGQASLPFFMGQAFAPRTGVRSGFRNMPASNWR
jgi:hypothetical protein